MDPETFFPAPSEPADAAVALCRTCEVQGACLAWALEVGDCHGVWGATTPRERRAMLVAWRTERQEPPEVVEPVVVTGFPPERLVSHVPEQRHRLPLLPLLNDRCVERKLVGAVERVAS